VQSIEFRADECAEVVDDAGCVEIGYGLAGPYQG
jgi:hypothetical protein